MQKFHPNTRKKEGQGLRDDNSYYLLSIHHMKDTKHMLSISLSEICKLHISILRRKTRLRVTALFAQGPSAREREQDSNSCLAVFQAVSTKPRSYVIKDKMSCFFCFHFATPKFHLYNLPNHLYHYSPRL